MSLRLAVRCVALVAALVLGLLLGTWADAQEYPVAPPGGWSRQPPPAESSAGYYPDSRPLADRADRAAPSAVEPYGATQASHMRGRDDVQIDDPVEKERIGRLVEQYLADREQQQADADKQKEKAEKEKGYTFGSDLSMKATWKNGLELQSPNKDFRVHIGGRTQIDGVWLNAGPGALDGAGGVGAQDAVDFRRARLRVDGTMYEFIDWAVEYDFVNSVNDNIGLQPASEIAGNVIHVPAPTDLWWDIKELPVVGHIRAGNMKEPIGLEHQTSSRFLDFLERSFNQDAFTGPFNNGFSPGVMLWNTVQEGRLHWALGAFKNTTNVFAFNAGDGEAAVTGRMTGLPWYDEASEGRYLLHVGMAGSFRDLDDGRVRVRSRASLRNGPGVLNPNLADTGFFLGDNQTLLAPEAALVLGPLMFQSEYIASFVTDSTVGGVNRGTATFYGYYVEALYFLTGEHRAYDHERGAFGRLAPFENFSFVRGQRGNILTRGAWQVGVRYGKLDLRDSGIDGGVIQDVTLGLNWFLNPNMKLQWNYVYTHRDAPGAPAGGDINGIGMRLAHDF